MIYANDLWIQLPVKDLYDSLIMLASIQAARDLYKDRRDDLKDFYSKYGDFVTPIAADQEYWANNIVGPITTAIDDMYKNGIDPLRNPLGAAMISLLRNRINRADMAALKQSAENAREFIKSRKQLEMQGLYSPEWYKYDGPDLDSYSTLGDNGQGVWDKMSPTPMQNLAAFSKDYFEGMKPNVHTESRNGISYQVELITEDDLRKIANDKFNELRNTPQGQVMYSKYLDITGDEDAARKMFNDAIVNANMRRTYKKDNYDDNYILMTQLKMQQDMNDWKKEVDRANINLLQQALDIKRMLGGSGRTSKTGTSGFGYNYEDYFKEDEWQLANNLGAAMASTDVGKADGIYDYRDFNPMKQGAIWPQAYDEIIGRNYADVFNDMSGVSVRKNTDYVSPFDPTNLGLRFGSIGMEPGYSKTGLQLDINATVSIPFTYDRLLNGGKKFNARQISLLKTANQNFINDISQSYDPVKFAKWSGRTPVSGDDAMINVSNDDDFINRTHDINETTSNSYGLGLTKEQMELINDTPSIRKFLGKKKENLYAKAVGKTYPILGVDGVTHLYVPVKYYTKSGRGSSISYSEVSNKIFAYDMGISTKENPNFNINGQAISDLFMNQNLDSDIRLSGNIGAEKYLHVSSKDLDPVYPEIK